MTGHHMSSYRARMGACLGFDPSAAAPLAPPRILLIDRPYSAGRHILNVAEVAAALQARYGAAAAVHVAHMDGLSLRDQAQLWGSQSLVIHMHGAALGNYPFLPRHAPAVQASWGGVTGVSGVWRRRPSTVCTCKPAAPPPVNRCWPACRSTSGPRGQNIAMTMTSIPSSWYVTWQGPATSAGCPGTPPPWPWPGCGPNRSSCSRSGRA